MTPRHPFGPQDVQAIFDRAVQERALAVLTLQRGQEWITFKSRFLERDVNRRFFVLDYAANGPEPLPDVAPGQYVGVSFRQKSRKLLFASVVEARGHFVTENATSIPAVRYRWPEGLTELQRRVYYRTPVPADMHLVGKVWRGGVAARAQGDAANPDLSGVLADISCGGALLRIEGQLPNWEDGETLGLELALPDGRPPIVVDVRYRGERDGQQPGLALQFLGLELAPDGRLVLQRLANSVQRLHRLEMASTRGRYTR